MFIYTVIYLQTKANFLLRTSFISEVHLDKKKKKKINTNALLTK